MIVDPFANTASFSKCERYRYTLTRQWSGKGLRPMLWILLNPSTATAAEDDPTIRRCMGYAKDWGFRGMSLVNIFAFRATNPKDMLAETDPIGPDNDSVIEDAMLEHSFIVGGWGAHGGHMGRSDEIIKMARRNTKTINCLGVTKGGEPRHPLYLRRDALPMSVWRLRG